MAEGVADSGQSVGAGHGPRLGAGRPEGTPADWVRDRQTKMWRPPKRPGPKPAEQPGAVEDQADAPGWGAERDPVAARLGGAGDGRQAHTEPGPSVDIDDELAAAVGLVGLVVLPAAERADPYCGPALTSCWDNVADKCVPLLKRSERVVRFMTATGGMSDWVGLAVALQPAAEAFVRHHITRTVEIVRVGPDGQQITEDASYGEYPAAA